MDFGFLGHLPISILCLKVPTVGHYQLNVHLISLGALDNYSTAPTKNISTTFCEIYRDQQMKAKLKHI